MRLMWLPLASLSSVLIYQATNPALYYLIGVVVYFWAYSEGEVSEDCFELWGSGLTWGQVICAVPWTLPKRTDRRRLEKA